MIIQLLILQATNLDCAGYTDEVYVGTETLFYKKLERKQIQDNYDITQDFRLWNDYQIIMSYLAQMERQ